VSYGVFVHAVCVVVNKRGCDAYQGRLQLLSHEGNHLQDTEHVYHFVCVIVCVLVVCVLVNKRGCDAC
jgi:hypothetical protein